MERHDRQRISVQKTMLRLGNTSIDVEIGHDCPDGSAPVQETFYDGVTAIRGARNAREGGERKGLAHLPLLHQHRELKSLRVGSLHNLSDKALQNDIDDSGPGLDGSVKAHASHIVKSVGPRQWLTPPYKVDDKIELLCQDSGIRGCWFRGTVLQSSQKRLKVRYDDVLNADESKNLEEWVPAFRPATSDKLGMRCPGRLTIRPSPTDNYLPDDVAFQIGTSVDSWWNDGWWEGVVIGVKGSGDDSVQVYLPGEGKFLERQRRDLRISRDWMSNQWVDVDVKPNILSAISMVGSGSTSHKGAGCSAIPDGGIRAFEAERKIDTA